MCVLFALVASPTKEILVPTPRDDLTGSKPSSSSSRSHLALVQYHIPVPGFRRLVRTFVYAIAGQIDRWNRMVPSNDDSEHRGRCSHAGAAVGELTAGDRIVVPRENNLEILVRVAIF